MGLWDGYPDADAWETASTVKPAFEPAPSLAPAAPAAPAFSAPQSAGRTRTGLSLAKIASPSGAGFQVNAEHAPRFQAFLKDLEDSGYSINKNASGGYNHRNIAGTNRLSKHAHGNAIDINWDENALGTQGKIPADVARNLAKKHGLIWGGDWKRPDPMHFEVPVAGQPGHTYGDGHNHGTPPTQAPGAPQVASYSRSKPMADSAESGGFFGFLSNLNKPMRILDNPENADILARAGPQGYQPIDADAFLEKHGLKHIPGAKDLIAISNMQRDLSASALQAKQPTWADGIGEALKGVGAVLSSRVDPKMALTMAGSVGQSHRDRQEMIQKLAMQQLLAQSSGLGDNLSDTVKTRLAEQHKRETRQGEMDRIYRGGTGAASSSAGAGASDGTAPVGTPAGTALGTPVGVPTPSAGPVPAAPAAGPPPAAGNAPTANTASAGGQQGAAPSVPGTNPQFPMPELPPPSPEAAALRRQADIAHQANHPEIAKDFNLRAEAVEKRHLEEWNIRTKPQREAAEAAMKKEAEIAAGEKQKLQKARENAVAMGGLFDNLKKHGRVDGIEAVIGPYDNSYIGRMFADMKPWGPKDADAGVRSLIEGDMAALSAIAKKITHNPGDGNFSDSDQKLLIQAIGAVLDAPNKQAYDRAIDEAKKRAERLLGTSIPTEKVADTSTGDKRTTETSVREPSEKALAAFRANAQDPQAVAAFKKIYGEDAVEKYLGRTDPFGSKGEMLRPGVAPERSAIVRPEPKPGAPLTAQQRYQQAIKRMYMEGRDG